MLLALTATAAGPLKTGLPFPESECMWSQAFYYSIWAAILYFVMATLQTITFWGAMSGHYDKDFYLTMSQRTLMLQTIMYLMYLLLGALVFSHVEDWNYLDAVYWANVTLFTIGFGDFSTSTNLGRALLFPYALVGIISLGLVIASIRSMVLERGARRVGARIEEKRRRATLRTMIKKGNDSILHPIHEEKTALSERNSFPSTATNETPANEFDRRKAEFELMRKIQDSAASRRRWTSMAISTGTWLALWLIGAYIFYESEKVHQDWSYYTAFYFCFISFTTVGYGDESPKSNAGKSFFVFWSLLTLPTMTVLISNAGDTVVKFIRDATLRLGNITILPSEEGFIGNLKHVTNKLSFGRFFRSYKSVVPEGHGDFLAYISEPSSDNNDNNDSNDPQPPSPTMQPDDRGRGQFLDIERAQTQGRNPSTFTSKVRRSLSRLRSPLNPLPTGTDFHFLLISEIQVVGKHLRAEEPRRYTFEEWAWYLKLIGEDERDPNNHGFPSVKARRRHGHRNRKEDEEASRVQRAWEDEEIKWSWVGHQSPLIGGQEESEWILERLMTRLKESLSAERRKQLQKKPKNPERIAKRLGYPPKKSDLGKKQ